MFQGKPIENVVMQAPSKCIRQNESSRVNGAALKRARAAKQWEQELVIANAIIAAASEVAQICATDG
jgi:hypothetical protein